MEMIQVVGTDGQYDSRLEPDLSDEDLRQIYRYMLMVRRFNERMMLLQRQGRIGFFIESTGEEACQIGSAWALNRSDWVYQSYRDAGMCLARGVPLKSLVDQLMGNADDPNKGRQMGAHWGYSERNMVSLSSPVATHMAQAVGTAYAAKFKKDNTVCFTSFGEGATSQGEFHSAMNFAGVFKVPIVFLCENNQYAISLPFRRQTASENVAVKAEAYGFEGVLVDGNDVLAIYKAAKAAVDKARSGGGPTLIEAVTYRIGRALVLGPSHKIQDPGGGGTLEATRSDKAVQALSGKEEPLNGPRGQKPAGGSREGAGRHDKGKREGASAISAIHVHRCLR